MSDGDIFRRKADEMLDTRLAAIEEELKLMRKVMEQVARFDERVGAMTNALDRVERRLDDFEKRIRQLEAADAKQTYSLGAIERIFWLAIATAAAWVGGHFK
jgi:uncharacterized protein Yka (UPF0111/DUF47 family)